MDCFSLGNLDAKRDWGHAKDYVEVGYWPESLYNKSDFVWLIFLMHRCKIKRSDLQGVTSDFFFSGLGQLTLLYSQFVWRSSQYSGLPQA